MCSFRSTLPKPLHAQCIWSFIRIVVYRFVSRPIDRRAAARSHVLADNSIVKIPPLSALRCCLDKLHYHISVTCVVS